MTGGIQIDRREDQGASLRGRILDVLPAATYQMDRFFQFTDIVVSDRSETACVEVGPQPRLHLNGEFVAEHCKRDEHLLMLVLHELYHVILGHTRLFDRLTQAHNIAFDAVINSMLCRQFPDGIYTDFFRDINPAGSMPGCLLRPPPGWPDKTQWPKSLPVREGAVVRALYGEAHDTVTYQEVLDLLEANGIQGNGVVDPGASEPTNRPSDCEGDDGDYVLLGDHDGQGEGESVDQAAVRDPLFTDILRRVTEDWPAEASPSTGRGDGGPIAEFLMPDPRSPKAEFLVALKALLRKAGVLHRDPHGPRTRKRVEQQVATATFVPDWRDRRAFSKEVLLGVAPLQYGSQITASSYRWTPREVAHVYIDISGSMSEHLPWLAGALDPLQRRGLCRLYAFSTVVAEVRRGGLLKDEIANTYGTDIGCVYDHMLALPARETPRKVVVLTDGMVGFPNEAQALECGRRQVEILVGLVGGDREWGVGEWADYVTLLPGLNS